MSPKSTEKMFYGWIIVLVGAVIALNLSGPRFSFGVFLKPLASEFDLSRTVTSSLFSAYMLFSAVVTIVGGWALDRYGARLLFLMMGLFTGLSLLLTSQAGALWQLFISYSLLLSIGSGPLYVVLHATISKWFSKKLGLAAGIAGAGMGLGQIVFAPLAALITSNFGWRISFIVLGLIIWLLVIPLSRLVRNDPKDIGAFPDGTKLATNPLQGKDIKVNPEMDGLSLYQALRTRNFWIFLISWPVRSFTVSLVMTHIVPYATDKSILAVEAATIISVIGVFGIPSGILAGRVSDIIGRKIPGVIFALLLAGAMVGLIWANELWMYYLFAFAFGISNGALAILSASLSVDMFGKRNIGVIMGTLTAVFSIGGALGPFVGGLVYDTFSSYTVAFVVAAVASIILALSIAFIRVERK